MERCCSSYQRLGNSTTLHWERIVSSPRSRCASGFLVLLPRYARRSPARHRCPQFLWRAYMEFLSNLCPALSNPASSSFPISPPPLAILGGAALGSDGEKGEEGRCTEEDCFFSKRSNHGAATTSCRAPTIPMRGSMEVKPHLRIHGILHLRIFDFFFFLVNECWMLSESMVLNALCSLNLWFHRKHALWLELY